MKIKILKYKTTIVVLFLATIVCLLLFDRCKKENTSISSVEISDSIKQVISAQYEARIDSLTLAGHKDSIRIQYVTKWRKMKQDTAFIPCDSILPQIVNLCDSIILVDSSQIATLKNIVALDDSIISNYKKVTKNDSLLIVSQAKDIKKHKRRIIGSAAIGSLFGIIAILK